MFNHFSAKALPLIARGKYCHIQGPKRDEPFSLVDIHSVSILHEIFGEKGKGSITIRRMAFPNMLVNFSSFAFLLNFTFMK